MLETDDGRDVLGYAEYLAAVMGRRREHGAISTDSFAIVADPELEGLSAPEVQEALRRARWDIPMIIPGPAGKEDLSRHSCFKPPGAGGRATRDRGAGLGRR